MNQNIQKIGLILALGLFSENTMAANNCVSAGPQTPRDIDHLYGENKRVFTLAPDRTEMNLCNIHLHVNAEHKAKDFSILARDRRDGQSDSHGSTGGYQCLSSKALSSAELIAPKINHCKGVKPGDTIEVHWVHTSCDVTPGKGLDACLQKDCTNPDLRVEAQVFTVVNDSSALDFNTMTYDGNKVNGYHQVKSIPDFTGNPVEFAGSTTGPKYTNENCSTLQVTWNVRPQCAKIDINSLSKWCEDNTFEENQAHGVRKLIVDPKFLSKIK